MNRFPCFTDRLRSGARLTAAACLLGILSPAQARVTRIVIDEVKPMASAAGQTVAYEQVAGRAFGVLDPRDPRNALIQDIQLGKDADSLARYTARLSASLPS